MSLFSQILQLAHLLGLDEAESEEGEASGWGQQMSNGRGHTLIVVTLVAIEVCRELTAREHELARMHMTARPDCMV